MFNINSDFSTQISKPQLIIKSRLSERGEIESIELYSLSYWRETVFYDKHFSG